MAENPIGGGMFTPGSDADGNRMAATQGMRVGGGDRFQADTQQLSALNAALTHISTNVKNLKRDLPEVIRLTNEWSKRMKEVATASQGMGSLSFLGKGGGARGASPTGAPAGTLTSQILGGGGGAPGVVDRSQNLFIYGAGAGGGGMGAGGGAAGIASAISSALAPLMGALNARIDRGASYGLGANRMDVLYQQMMGQSRGQIYQNQRMPLQQYMLGPGGINEVLGLQASTGINARLQGQSVEALRVASGYGYSTGQINQMTQGLANPESANRMFMMLGTGLYGIGGKQRGTMDVVKDVVRRMGLTSESSLAGAMAPGSMTRERLRQSGLPEDMQDLVLQYAKQNLAYQKKGGRGMYSPGDKYSREFMGVQDAYATQFEETERVKTQREESFYNKQEAAFSDMEKSVQSLTRAMQKLEEAMAPLIGAKIRTRPYSGLIKAGFTAAGAAIGSIIPGAGTVAGALGGAAIGGAIGNIITGPSGDPTEEKDTSTKPGGSAPANIQKNKAELNKLHPRMREKIQRMMEANPRLYIGSGVRSAEDQKRMFLDRYQPTSEKTDVFWKGKYWKRVKGAQAAPPGMSMHEIGLAVDLAPSSEFKWITKNAEKFGLKHFQNDGEPWHVQPAELPGSRIQYEKMGAPWGHNGKVSESTDTRATINNLGSMEHSGLSEGIGGGNLEISKFSGLSMSESIETMSSSIGSMRSYESPEAYSSGSQSTASGGSSSTTTTPPSNKALSGVEAARILYKAGFRGKGLVTAMAIAKRESGLRPGALNPNARTKDLSYGLFQINMFGNLGPSRRQQYGIKKNEELFDPSVNAAAAFKLSGGGKNWYHWGEYKGMEATYKTDIKKAEEWVKQAGYKTTGDPMASAAPALKSNSAGSTIIQGDTGHSFNITIAPTINLHGGSNYSADVEKMAKDVSRLVDREVRMAMLRTS